MNNNKLKLLELFGGIGACSSALTRLGINYEIADYVEIDKYAVASYNAIHGTNFEPQDITMWDKDIKVDLIMHGSPCVTADSLILTKDGYKPITDVQVGDEVLTKSNVWQKVAKKFDNGVHQTCYLDGMGFENIHCTLNHKFYVREMYRKGHKSIRYFKEPVFKMAKDLTEKDYFGVPVIQDEKPFYTNECDFWYMLGMYLGDGWLSKTTNDIIIACNDTKLEKLKARLNQEKWKYTYYKERTCYKFRFSNKKIYEFIEKYIGTGSNKKNIPYEILCLPKLQLQNFYDGYLDSDGCIVNERHQFSSINRNLIYSISLIINKLYKRPTSIYKNKVKNTKEIEGRLVNQKDWYLLRFNPNKKMQDKAFYEDGYVWYPFNKLVMAEKENVYNMEVEEDHSYIVQGCISKNCQDFSLAGKQAGGDKDSGTRSSLMYETLRIVEKLKPKYVIWENVKNLISKNHIHNFESYLKSMKELGYKNYYKVLNAKDYGIPQNRERIFTISKLDDEPFEFPSKQELKLKLKDMLEDKVDEKYYLSEKAIHGRMITHYQKYKLEENCINNKEIHPTILARFEGAPTLYKETIQITNATKKGYLEACEGDGIDISSRMQYHRGNVQKESIQTITTSGGNDRGVVDVVNQKLRIRKLTPLETWRLMGFTDEEFEKAAFKKETSYIEGGLKCNAKLKIVNEKQRHLDMETYALCTTNDMLDMETPIQTKWKKSIENENNEKMQNVNIAIEMLDEVEQKECVTNIIKCGENTTILYTLMEELDQHHMAIIELGKRGEANIEKYMKITLEENLNPMKLYTISTLIEQIIKSKIYTCITQKANIQGNIAIIEDCVKNLKMMKLSNLKMEYITRLNSDTMLYKQAGNSIVVNVLEAILTNLLIEKEKEINEGLDGQ